MPAEILKNKDGEWIVQGLASTPSRDLQGEVILPEGIDATPIDTGRGVLNWDHQKGPENVVGLLDSYRKTKEGFFVKGRLLRNHSKAKAIHEIMSSLGKSDKGRMGLSVEGKIFERAGKDGKIIKKCQINAVALTMNPVNPDSYVDLVKSISGSSEVEFQATNENLEEKQTVNEDAPLFTAPQVLQLIEKALGVGAGATNLPPPARTGGDALAQESSEKKEEPKKKKLKPMTKEMYKSSMIQLLDKIQHLYPDASRTDLWEAVKTRLSTRFPEVSVNAK